MPKRTYPEVTRPTSRNADAAAAAVPPGAGERAAAAHRPAAGRAPRHRAAAANPLGAAPAAGLGIIAAGEARADAPQPVSRKRWCGSRSTATHPRRSSTGAASSKPSDALPAPEGGRGRAPPTAKRRRCAAAVAVAGAAAGAVAASTIRRAALRPVAASSRAFDYPRLRSNSRMNSTSASTPSSGNAL